MAQKLYVRFSTSKDEQKIFDYYKENPHQFVFQRDPDVWKERIASGAVTLIEDESGKLVASAISYPIVRNDEAGNPVHKWTEIGSVRVTLDGFGLGKTLISAQVLRAYLLEPPRDRFILDIAIGNIASKTMFTHLGATLKDLPTELVVKEKTTTTVGGKGTVPVEWLQIGAEAVPGMANILLEREKNPTVVNKQTGDVYEMDFSKCVLMTQFKDEVKVIAAQNFGNVAAPDYSKTLQSTRSVLKHKKPGA